MADFESFSVRQPAGGWRGRWSWRRRIAVGLAAFALVLGLTAWVLHRAAQIRRQTEIDLIRAAGEPLTFEDLEALREPISDDHNGALKIIPLFNHLRLGYAALQAFGNAPDQSAACGVRWNAERLRAAEIFLSLEKDVLAELHAAAALEQGNFPNEWTVDLPYRYGSQVWMATRLLALEAVVRAHHGDIDGAMASCEVMLQIAGWLEGSPCVILMLMRNRAEWRAIETLQTTLALGEPDDAWLDRLHARLRRLDTAPDRLRRPLLGERVIMIDVYSAWRAGQNVGWSPVPAGGWFAVARDVPGYLDLNEQKYLQLTRAQIEAASLPFKQSLPRMKELDAAYGQLSFAHAVTRTHAFTYARVVELHAGSSAHIRAAYIAVEVEQYRRVHGDWPATLQEAFGDDPAKLPIDPFTDATPMRYLVDEAGCVVYSIGENGQDDGGSIEKSDAKRMKDVGFRLLSPHLRGATVSTRPVDKYIWDTIEKSRIATTQPAEATVPGQ